MEHRVSPELSAPLIASYNHSTQSLYAYWRLAELVTGLTALCGLVLATIDYEIHYDLDRSYEHCQGLQNKQTYRLLILCVSMFSIVSLVFRFYAKRRWEQSFLKSISSLPVYLNLFERLEFGKDTSFWTCERCFDIVVLVCNPFPYFELPVHIPQRTPAGHNWETKYICYSSSELLYIVMFLRVWLMVKACFNYAVFQNDISKLYCRKMHVSANRRFTFKSLMKRYPMKTLSCIIVVSFLWISLCLRVVERPYVRVSDFDFEALTTSMWCVIVSLSTIGYGDVVPATSLGQMLISLTIILGALLFSLCVVVLSKEIQMDNRQNQAYHLIRNSKKAVSAISAGYLYYLSKKLHGAHDNKTLTRYAKLRWEGNKFKRYKDKFNSGGDEIEARLSRLEKLMLEVRDKLTN
jgi:hypothetical protein